jgi:hypothetical protein
MRLVLVLGLVMLAPRRADACSYEDNRHYLDPAEQGVDVTPPGPVIVGAIEILRGEDNTPGCGVTGSCDGTGFIGFEVSSSDDRTPAELLGYRVELVSGTLPAGALPLTALRADGALVLRWDDGTSDHEAFSAELRIVPVDLAGNEGLAATVTVADEPPGGCRAGGGGGGAFLGVVAVLLLGRRRRACRPLACRLDGEWVSAAD